MQSAFQASIRFFQSVQDSSSSKIFVLQMFHKLKIVFYFYVFVALNTVQGSNHTSAFVPVTHSIWQGDKAQPSVRSSSFHALICVHRCWGHCTTINERDT